LKKYGEKKEREEKIPKTKKVIAVDRKGRMNLVREEEGGGGWKGVSTIIRNSRKKKEEEGEREKGENWM